MYDDELVAISHAVAAAVGWTESQRQDIISRYVAFLDHVAHGQSASPELDEDALWHEHILHTRSYAEYCHRRFGRYIHHRPQLSTTLRRSLPLRSKKAKRHDFQQGFQISGSAGKAECSDGQGPSDIG